MAVSFAEGLLNVGAGVLKGASDEQAAKQAKVDKRIEQILNNQLEVAKSRHKTEYEDYAKRGAVAKAIESAGSDFEKEQLYAQHVMGMDYKSFVDFKKRGGSYRDAITEEKIAAYRGDEPLFNYDIKPEYEDVVVPNRLYNGLREAIGRNKKPSVEEQLAAIDAKYRAKQPGAIQRAEAEAQVDVAAPFAMAPGEEVPQGEQPVQPITAATGEPDWTLETEDPTAAMRNREANAALLRKMNPELTEDESMIMAYQIEMAKTTPGMAGVVSPVDYFVRGAGGFEAAAERRAEEQATQPSVSTKEAMALVNIYMDQNPYGGAIENQDQYVSDLADLARNISAREKIPFSEARSIAEEMLLPDTSLIKSGDTWVPNIIEENYSYNPDQKISYETVNEYKRMYPGKSTKEIIRAIRNQRTQGK
jgi:hypothetical protein